MFKRRVADAKLPSKPKLAVVARELRECPTFLPHSFSRRFFLKQSRGFLGITLRHDKLRDSERYAQAIQNFISFGGADARHEWPGGEMDGWFCSSLAPGPATTFLRQWRPNAAQKSDCGEACLAHTRNELSRRAGTDAAPCPGGPGRCGLWIFVPGGFRPELGWRLSRDRPTRPLGLMWEQQRFHYARPLRSRGLRA
jgi:hypothetical protein